MIVGVARPKVGSRYRYRAPDKTAGLFVECIQQRASSPETTRGRHKHHSARNHRVRYRAIEGYRPGRGGREREGRAERRTPGMRVVNLVGTRLVQWRGRRQVRLENTN